jgi:AcrR family transcriptional regulator
MHNNPTFSADPRAMRTRQLLLDSFSQLKKEHTSIHSISVLDITRLAGVNRATFYAHFTDKYQILDIWMRDFFRSLLKEKLPETLSINDLDLYVLIDATLEVLELHRLHRRTSSREYETIFDSSIQQELQDTLTLMFSQTPAEKGFKDNVLLHIFLSWAIFGVAKEAVNKELLIKEKLIAEMIGLIHRTIREV